MNASSHWSDHARRQWRGLAAHADPRIWISVVGETGFEEQVAAIEAQRSQGKNLPLLGRTFAVKDNIDAVRLPTTAGCPAYAYTPTEDAAAVARLKAAGAIVLGKTTLDQFATGLVGVRSPHGPCPNVFNPDYISGGSSSGSAAAVARGEADFSLGTDTAGSGRVPAALNKLIGYKPTKGILGTRGVVPACRSLDCVSIFGRTVAETAHVAALARGYDPADPWSRPNRTPSSGTSNASFRFGVPRPDQLRFFGDAEAPALYAQAVARLKAAGGEAVEIDYAPFAETAALLYQGPWVAERYAGVGDFIEANREACDPTVAAIILGGKTPNAVAAFRAMYRLEELRRATEPVWSQIDCLVLPTLGALYRIDEVLAQPVELNTNLGFYNNFLNLLDLAAVAVPTGAWSAGPGFGVNLVGPAFSDDRLLGVAARVLGEASFPVSTDGWVKLAVVGAHLRGQPLNHQLTSLNAAFVTQTRTSTRYRLHALAHTQPPKPGLQRVAIGGAAIEVEVFALTPEAFGQFVAAVPPPLCIGSVELEDGSWVKGFLCEPAALTDAPDISGFGGWRAFLGAKAEGKA